MERGRFRRALSACGGVCACADVCVNKLVWVFWLGGEEEFNKRSKGRVCLKKVLSSHPTAWLLDHFLGVPRETQKKKVINS